VNYIPKQKCNIRATVYQTTRMVTVVTHCWRT